MNESHSDSDTNDQIVARFVRDHLGAPVLANTIRGLYLESMLAEILEPSWRYVGASYGGWDFENTDRVRLEVKQTAHRQTWSKKSEQELARPKAQTFSIRRKRAVYNAQIGQRVKVDQPYRLADIYVFARHVGDGEGTFADQRHPSGWNVALVAEGDLPATSDSISEVIVARRWGFQPLTGLVDRLDVIARTVPLRA